MVDDFAIKYTSLKNFKHLLNALQAKYTISEDWEAKLYIGITLKWNYIKLTVDLSIPGYVTTALPCFRHQLKKQTINTTPICRTNIRRQSKISKPEDNAPLLPEERIKFIQQVVGVFMYYATAIDNTVLVFLSDIGSEQSRETVKTMDEVQHLLDYLASNPNATICFHIETFAC